MMVDRNYVRLHVGDSIRTSTNGVCTIKAEVAPDNGKGAIVRVINPQGKMIDLALGLSNAELVREKSKRV